MRRALAAALMLAPPIAAQGPYQTTGFKVGEVTPTAAVVWTRLTERAQRMPDGRVAGTPGKVRCSWRVRGSTDWTVTAWADVDPEHDFTHQFQLTKLTPERAYELRVESKKGASAGATLTGSFRTAPPPDRPAKVVFTVTTGQRYPRRDSDRGFKIYDSMRALDPSFFVHTGDVVYYDQLAKSPALARWHWQRTYSLPTNVEFHRHVASYFEKDDHDIYSDDCWPGLTRKKMGDMTFEAGVSIFKEQVPSGSRPYRRFRWGRDLDVWLVEGREFRSPNPMPDGPDKTIWGAAQKAWFKRTVTASDATFRILISPTPIVGPDRKNKRDNHANAAFKTEGDELKAFIAAQSNMIVICGDRHWQYHSVDPKTGLREYSCGPATDKHAGGWKQKDLRKRWHRYLNVIGGFLSVTVDRPGGKPLLFVRFHDVAGRVRASYRLRSP